MIVHVPARIPRHAFSPRNAARAGDVWRLLQEIATDGSAARGWPPDRYAREGIGFVVRELTCVHHRETSHGEALQAETWVRDFRRGLFTTREIRVTDAAGGPVVSAAQGWVHVRVEDGPAGPTLKPARASEAVLAAFPPLDGTPPVTMPTWAPHAGALPPFPFTPWFTSMDPLGHANHPAYVDWIDEALARAVAARGLDPHGVVPIAEHVTYRDGVRAGDEVTVSAEIVGRIDDAVVLACRIAVGAREAATATVIRRHLGGALAEVLG